MQKMFQRSALLRPFLQLHLSFQQCQIFVLLLAVSGQLGWFNYFNKVNHKDLQKKFVLQMPSFYFNEQKNWDFASDLSSDYLNNGPIAVFNQDRLDW